MPPKADAKAKAKAKGKAAARRPSQAKVQKPGSKKGGNVPVEIEIKATLDSALNKGDPPMRVGGIEVTGQHNLSRILVESIVALPFVRGFSKVCLRRISYYPKGPERPGPPPSLSLSPASARSARGKPQSEAIQFIQVEETRPEEVDCASLFLALCVGVEASRPQLIRVGPAELLAEEAKDLQKYQDAYGICSPKVQQLPEVVHTRHKHSLMVFPLAGGRCLLPPLSEAAVEDINSFTKIFNDAISATDGLEGAGFISRALRGTQHVCCSVLLQPMLQGCTEELINLTQVFTNVEDIMLGKTHPELSVDYYDGLGANAIGVEKEQIDDFRGGPTTDGVAINELNKMVFDLVPGMKQTRPTEFLAWFHSQMQQSGTFWNLKAIYSTTSAAIDFDAVLQDEDGHAFLAPCSCNAQFPRLATLRAADAALDWKYRHVFSRIARWMLSGLLLHSPIHGPGDLKWLRELCMILAGMPEDLSLSLPPPPDQAPLHLRFAWSFVRRCVRCLRWHNPMMVNGKLVHLQQPGLQMVWALLDAAIELVPDEHTKSYPERKRLALWASLCFAIRLAVACKKMEETGWLTDRLKLWGRFDDGIDLEGLAAQVYVTRFGVQESWSRDPVSKETRSVFLDDLPWEVIPLVDETAEEEDVKTEYPEADLDADAEAAVATVAAAQWADTVSAAEQAAVLKGAAVELDAAQTALKDLEPSMGRQVRKAWESAKRFVVTGGIGQGKRAISKNVMADLTLAELCTEVSRFPVRLKLADLQDRSECADAIQDFCSSEPATCAACAWERLPPPPWMGRFNHQVICVDGKIFVTGGVSTQTGKHLQDAWISTDGQNWEDLPAAPWPPRSSHQVVWWEDRLILLGGLGDDDRRFRDAWQTTDFGLTWQELPCPKWSGRSGHRCMVLSLAVKAPARPYLVLMGGSGAGNRALKDVWVSDSGGFSWTELEALPCSPRWNFHVANLNQCLWITGGEDENHHCFNDCWVLHGCQWNPKGSGVSASNVSRWKSEATLGEDGWRGPFTAPWTARTQHQVVPFRGQLALFGGYDEKNQVLYDAWVSQDGITWQVLPHFAWAQASGRAGHQVLTLQDGRSMVFGGLGGGRDVLRSRSLAVVIEDIPPTLPEEEAAVKYLNRLLQEPGHLVMCVTSIPRLERPVQEGEEEELPEEETVYSLLQRWNFSELHVKPLEGTHLRKLCRRWTHGMEVSEKVEAEMLLPDNYDLVNSPLMAIMVLRALAPRRERRDVRHPLTRCQLYEHMFKRIFQSQKAVKAYDDSEFPLLHKQGMATACCELAYEGLGKRSRCIKLHELQAFIASLAAKEVKVEQMEKLVKTAHAGQLLLLEDYQQGGLRFRYPSMQDYLAAQCAWLHLLEGKGLPAWLIQENAAGNVSEEVTSCAKFFCLQAEGREPLKKEMLLELREGLAFLLQTMCKAGNALAIRCLLGIAAAGGRQQLMAMHSQSGNHPTGLHLAAIHGHKDVVETLLALAPEPMQLCLAVNSDGMAPLHCAARDGHEATARALLQRAPDGFSLLQMPQKSSSALRPLHWAAKQGHVEVVKCFLEFAPKPAVICVEADSAGNTALHFAAAGGHTVTCHALLTHAGPSNELSDRAILLLSAVNRFDRQTALHIAADRGEKEVVDTLLHGAPDRSALLGMSDKLGQTALHLSCERGHGAVVRKLLHSGDSHLVAARERITGQTALHMAAEAGHNEAVRAILEASPLRETSLATDRGARNTALHLAAERGHLQTVKTLVEHCPDTESLLMAQEKFAGQTALHLAAGAGHAELCKVLLELAHTLSSTMLSTQDKSGGFTPLQLACEKGHADVIEVLLEGDPDKGARLKESLDKWSGFTALHLVAYRGHEDAAKVMLRLAPDKRALLSSKDERGRTAGDLAMERGRRNVASLLSES